VESYGASHMPADGVAVAQQNRGSMAHRVNEGVDTSAGGIMRHINGSGEADIVARANQLRGPEKDRIKAFSQLSRADDWLKKADA